MFIHQTIKISLVVLVALALPTAQMSVAQEDDSPTDDFSYELVNLFTNPNLEDTFEFAENHQDDIITAAAGLVSAGAVVKFRSSIKKIDANIAGEQIKIDKALTAADKNLKKMNDLSQVTEKSLLDRPRPPKNSGIYTKKQLTDVFETVKNSKLPNGASEHKVTVLVTERVRKNGPINIDPKTKIGTGKTYEITGTQKEVFKKLRNLRGWFGFGWRKVAYINQIKFDTQRTLTGMRLAEYARAQGNYKKHIDKISTQKADLKKLQRTRRALSKLKGAGVLGVIGAIGIGAYRQGYLDNLLEKIENMGVICQNSELTELRALGSAQETLMATQPSTEEEITDDGPSEEDLSEDENFADSEKLEEAYTFHEAALEEFCNSINQED